jgi:hypothetical protein
MLVGVNSCRFAGVLLCLASLFCVESALSQGDQRGARNYQEILAGRKKLEQLSRQEQLEVIQIHKRMQAARAGGGQSPECRQAREEATNAASELADYARKLRSCAEAQDFSDDCDSEFRRVKSAYDDYESAVSSVSSSCN